MRKNYIINILLLLFILIILLTLKMVILNNLTFFCAYFGWHELGQAIANFHEKYLFKPVILGDNFEAPILFDSTYRFVFDNILFKFSVLNITFLLLLKYRKQIINITKEDLPFILIFLAISVYFFALNEDKLILKTYSFFINGSFKHFLHYFIFILFNIEIFILFPLNALYIYKDIKFSFLQKGIFLITLIIFMYTTLYSDWYFLNMSIDMYNHFNMDYGIIYIMKQYGFNYADCMNDAAAQTKETKPCHAYKYLADKNCFESKTSTGPLKESQLQSCNYYMKKLRQECTGLIAESKK